jgi:hypothetical protein
MNAEKFRHWYQAFDYLRMGILPDRETCSITDAFSLNAALLVLQAC